MLKKTTESKLLAGYIYGDNVTKEYVYLPGSEVDTEEPMCTGQRILDTKSQKLDVKKLNK